MEGCLGRNLAEEVGESLWGDDGGVTEVFEFLVEVSLLVSVHEWE